VQNGDKANPIEALQSVFFEIRQDAILFCPSGFKKMIGVFIK
jgi:hypothetical protein